MLANDTKSHQGAGWCHSRCFSYGGTQEFKQAVKTSKLTNHGTIVVIGGGYVHWVKLIRMARKVLRRLTDYYASLADSLQLK
jgi:hypothetical protein